MLARAYTTSNSGTLKKLDIYWTQKVDSLITFSLGWMTNGFIYIDECGLNDKSAKQPNLCFYIACCCQPKSMLFSRISNYKRKCVSVRLHWAGEGRWVEKKRKEREGRCFLYEISIGLSVFWRTWPTGSAFR